MQLNNPKTRENDAKQRERKGDSNSQLMISQKQVQFSFAPIFKDITPINKVYLYGDFPVEIDFF